MIPNQTSHRRSSSFRPSSFIFKPHTSNANLPPSPKENDETSTINSNPPNKDETQPPRRPSGHGQLQPRHTSVRIPPNTSPDIAQNWLTTPPSPIQQAAAPPRFSRAGIKGVVMPVRAERSLSLVDLPEGYGEAVGGGGEDGVPLNELELEPKRVGPLQRALSSHSQMWKTAQQPRLSEGDDGQCQGQGQNQGQGQGQGRRQGIVSALGRGLSLGSDKKRVHPFQKRPHPFEMKITPPFNLKRTRPWKFYMQEQVPVQNLYGSGLGKDF
ncbi:hypothetical protein BU17DRAFT_68682 [Hysterangium stoloniferum]|nr:hypothetical protein BU17DRAFT_68682 [Hysterangium stoloniferum]